MVRQRAWGCAGAVALTLIVSAVAPGQEAQEPTTRPAGETTGAQDTPASAVEQPSVATPPEQSAEEAPRPGRVSAEEVLREFQRDRPKAQPLLPKAPADETITRRPAGAGERGEPLRMPDGHFLVDRAGQLMQDGVWWAFAFVADNNPDRSPEPPMKLLPNQMLERMIRESQGASRTVEFIVSGEVTDFMGENYLLLRKLMRKRETGNLSK